MKQRKNCPMCNSEYYDGVNCMNCGYSVFANQQPTHILKY
jgi:DNA-directed RNA polymerase subunit RPC12/RpoP